LFIFDSCFSGSLFALSRAVPEHISYKTAKPVRLFITSGSADEKVPDTSIFRQQFIAALDGEGDLNADGYMTGAELSDFVFKNVVNYSKGTQHPQYGKIRNPNLDKGDFVFRMKQLESEETDLSDSSFKVLERQQSAKERKFWKRKRKETNMAFPLPDKPSIAILPFDNMSGDPAQDYLADGISENIISALSRISNLFVIARNSTFTYKGKPVKVQQVSENLGVRYVLEGSVQKSGSRLRVIAQLNDAIMGNHLWSEKYDLELIDLFVVQDEVTKKIITALNVELTQGEQARTLAKGTDNLEAYLKVMQAREHIYKHNIESNASAQQLVQEALTLDPNYAAASRILGVTHMHDVMLGISKSPKESMGEAIKLVKRAIELDDQDGYSHVVSGYLLTMVRQYDKAVAEAERGVALDPNVADIYGWLGMVYRYVGRWEDAVVAYEKAIRLNPIPPNFYLQGLGLSYAWTERYEEAITVFEKATQDHPDAFYLRLFAAAVYSLVGRDEEAQAEAAEVLRLNPKFSLERWEKSLRYKNQEDQEQFINALSKAGLK
jgi:TolB-like protein